MTTPAQRAQAVSTESVLTVSPLLQNTPPMRAHQSRSARRWRGFEFFVIITENNGVRGVEILNELGGEAVIANNEPQR